MSDYGTDLELGRVDSAVQRSSPRVTHESIDKILERHEKIEMLVDKTDQLSRTAQVIALSVRFLQAARAARVLFRIYHW